MQALSKWICWFSGRFSKNDSQGSTKKCPHSPPRLPPLTLFFFALAVTGYILLAYSLLYIYSVHAASDFDIFCVKIAAMRNKSVSKIVCKRAFQNAAKQEASAFRERAPAAAASRFAKCCAFYACQRFLRPIRRIAAAHKNRVSGGKPRIFLSYPIDYQRFLKIIVANGRTHAVPPCVWLAVGLGRHRR